MNDEKFRKAGCFTGNFLYFIKKIGETRRKFLSIA